MKKIIFYSAAFAAILFLFSSCTKNIKTDLTDELKVTIQNEVKEQFENLEMAIRELNYDSWIKFYSKESFISALTTSRGLVPTYQTWADSLKVSFENRTRHQSEIVDVSVTAISTDMALLTLVGIWGNWYKNGDYRKIKGLATYVWKKEQTGWKVIHIHESRQQILEESLIN